MTRLMIDFGIDDYIAIQLWDENGELCENPKTCIVNNPSKSLLKRIYEDNCNTYCRCFRHHIADIAFMAKEFDEQHKHLCCCPENTEYLYDGHKRRLRSGISDEVRETLREMDAEAFKLSGEHIIVDFDDGVKPARKPFDVFYERWIQLHPKKANARRQ
ncbi:MAG: hypothetical protein Q4D98_06250 [Planctomycetia bacterium]|nr:hypothetical protein [Planctomycetia bacterium]